MYRVKNLLDTSALLTLYNSLVLPYLTYCVEAWGNTYPTNLLSIIRLQKRAVRTLGNLGFCDHTNPVFISLNLLKFVDLVKLKTGVLMYKCYHGLLNERLNRLFSLNNSNTRQKMNFYVIYKRTKLKSFSISCYGVLLWNNLDIDIRSSKSVIIFKRKMKKYLISLYMDS